MTKTLVVLSGGQDSTTCLFWAKALLREGDELHAVTFDYGQRHRLEIEAAKKVAKLAGVTSHEVIEVPRCLRSVSPLVDQGAQLEKYENFDQMSAVIGDRVELTFVPMRNTLFLTIAANRAVALGCASLVTGVCQEDNANYPDCRQDYVSTMEAAINVSLGYDKLDSRYIIIATPLMFLSKAETVMLAKTLGDDAWNALAYSHTSYDGKYPPTDKNHSNVLRAQGFLNAGLPDPLVVRAYHEGLMSLPETENYKQVI